MATRTVELGIASFCKRSPSHLVPSGVENLVVSDQPGQSSGVTRNMRQGPCVDQVYSSTGN